MADVHTEDAVSAL